MSISSEITRITAARDLAIRLCEEKGATLTGNETLEDLVGLIAQLGNQGDTISDVQVDGTSVVTDGVANIPVAGSEYFEQTYGVVKLSNETLLNTSGRKNWSPSKKIAISMYDLDHAVKLAMSDGKGAAWTEAEQEAARARLGITGTGGSNITKLSELENDLGFVTGDVVIVSSEAPTEGDTKVWIKDADNEEVELLTPSDLDNYYTKSEVDDVLEDLDIYEDTDGTIIVDGNVVAGGGSASTASNEYRLIKTYDLDMDHAVTNLLVDTDADGNHFRLSSCLVRHIGIKPLDEANKTSLKAWICINSRVEGYNKGYNGWATSSYFGYDLRENYYGSPLGYIMLCGGIYMRMDNGLATMSDLAVDAIEDITISGYQQKAWYGHIEVWGKDM